MKSVTVTDLVCQRGTFRLGPVSFDVPASGRVAIVGPSGSGKTTLLRCIAGLERPAAGSIRVGNDVVADERTNVPPDRRGLGLVFQDGALWPHLTALQHLRFAAPSLTNERALALLQRVGLGEHAKRKPASLSGGEAQRLGFVRALAAEPGVLLLDEPLRSVDVHQRDSLVLLLRTLCDERALTTILVTHDRDEALALATYLVVVHEGRIVEQGPALSLLQKPRAAFTAAFLLGAACLPLQPGTNGTVATPFGAMPRPAGSAERLHLVLAPGSTTAVSVDPGLSAALPRARVLACLPDAGAFRVHVQLHDQLVQARAAGPFAVGADVALSLTGPAPLLPWQPDPPS